MQRTKPQDKRNHAGAIGGDDLKEESSDNVLRSNPNMHEEVLVSQR